MTQQEKDLHAAACHPGYTDPPRETQPAESDPLPVREFRVRICNACYALTGEMCHNPSCVFCRRTMAEVGEMLDALLIRPLVDGERYDLHPTGALPPGASAVTPQAALETEMGRLRALVAQFHREADEADEDGDFCCGLTRRNDAIQLAKAIEPEASAVTPATVIDDAKALLQRRKGFKHDYHKLLAIIASQQDTNETPREPEPVEKSAHDPEPGMIPPDDEIASITVHSAPMPNVFVCRAATGRDPEDSCGWPTCSCDRYANKVIDALEAAGTRPDKCAHHPDAAREWHCVECFNEPESEGPPEDAASRLASQQATIDSLTKEIEQAHRTATGEQ